MSPADRNSIDEALLDLLCARSILDMIRQDGDASMGNALHLIMKVVETSALLIDRVIDDNFGPPVAAAK